MSARFLMWMNYGAAAVQLVAAGSSAVNGKWWRVAASLCICAMNLLIAEFNRTLMERDK